MKKYIPYMALSLKGRNSWYKKLQFYFKNYNFCGIWGNLSKIWYFVNICFIKILI